MWYLSQLLNTPIEDQQGERVGKIVDVLLPVAQSEQSGPAYPSALLMTDEDEEPWRVPLASVQHQDGSLRLLVPVDQLSPQFTQPDQQEISLAHDVLDKQVIDIKQKKALRVNDVCLADDWRTLGVDHSVPGLLRRLAPSWLVGKEHNVPSHLTPWDHIELIAPQPPTDQDLSAQPLADTATTMRALGRHLTDMHPADIAEIVHQLTPGQGARIIEGLDNEAAAEAMEEIDTERQRYILESMKPERAADILQAMGPDEAADLLAEFPEERTQQLLHLMNPEESEEVQDLLEYEADTAGGLMTTDFVILSQTRTVAETLQELRTTIQENDIRSPYVYCVADEEEDECPLLGVVSIWDLLLATPTQTLQQIMETDLISVQPDSDAQTVAETMAKYNLLAVPVLNQAGIIEGIVTVDDALDVLLPPQRRRQKMY